MQSIPRMIDEQLAAHGARSVYARGEGDARSDLDGQFESWFAKLAPLAMKEFGRRIEFQPAAPRTNRSTDRAGGAVSGQCDRGARRRRADEGAGQSRTAEQGRRQRLRRSTRHIEVQLPPDITYRVGDHLSVVPRNDPALVDSVARRFGFLPADQIRLQVAEGRRAQLPVGDAVSVGRLLTDFVELQQVATRKQIQIMSEHTRCPMTKPKLSAYIGDDAAASEHYRADILGKRKSVFDLLEEHPACELPFHAYLEMLSLLAPRYYSISSSPSGDPSRCSVTVGVVEGPASSGRGVYKGICSNYLASRREGETVQATVRETKAGFRLPEDPSVPIIMVGPGTGLAPFRGFLQERAALKSKGREARPGDAVFRLPHPDQDFLYADELKAFEAGGITELHTRRSRARKHRRPTCKNLVAAQKERVWSLIESGAIIYVCGDGGKMEPDVKAALVAIYRERKGADADAGLRWIDDLGAKNRYVLDVWAGG
jgi:cytochrome P450/NADPH-cytochrome P450 reductase